MMGVKSAVKRKSINNCETPNKIRKTHGVVNEKTSKKSEKNQKTAQKVNTNKFQKTPQKKNKHIPKEEEELSENESEEQVEVDSNEESDDVEQNDLEVSDDDNEKESDSDEDEEEAEENNSKEDAEENNSDEEVVKQPSPRKQTHLDRCKYTVYVSGLRGADFRIPDIFKDCKHTYYFMLKNRTTGKPIGSAFVNFDDEENYKKALLKNGTVINGATIIVLPKRSKEEENQNYNIYVTNLSRTSKVDNIFSDCKIVTRKIIPSTKSALLYLEDEDSIQKALEKDQTEHDGSLITVQRRDCAVFMKGVTENMKIDEIFSDCKINSHKLYKNKDTGKLLGTGSVFFADVQSYKIALAKSGTEIDGSTITVEPHKTMDKKKKTNKPFKKNTKKTFKKNTNKSFKKKISPKNN